MYISQTIHSLSKIISFNYLFSFRSFKDAVSNKTI